jgi:phage gpG-like protein
MAGITFTVDLQDAEAKARLAELVDRMERPIGFYKNVGKYLTDVAIPRNFANESSPSGQPWARLRPTTIRARERKGQTPLTILRASGRLAASIVSQADDNGVRVGSPVPQAAVMQFGAAQGAFGAAMGRTRPSDKRPKSQDYFFPIPWGNIPGREYLGLSPADELEIYAIAEEWLSVE